MATDFKPCSVEGCKGNASRKAMGVRGWCCAHHKRWVRHGDPLAGRPSSTPRGEAKRYYREVVLAYDGDDCLIWPYSCTGKGYGVLDKSIVSRLVCEEVNGPPPTPKHDAAHSCGKGRSGCVTKGHLSWKTRAENMADTLIHGTRNRGERNGTAKLAKDDVREIRAMKGVILQVDIARKYGVSVGTVRTIHQGTRWAWLS